MRGIPIHYGLLLLTVFRSYLLQRMYLNSLLMSACVCGISFSCHPVLFPYKTSKALFCAPPHSSHRREFGGARWPGSACPLVCASRSVPGGDITWPVHCRIRSTPSWEVTYDSVVAVLAARKMVGPVAFPVNHVHRRLRLRHLASSSLGVFGYRCSGQLKAVTRLH